MRRLERLVMLRIIDSHWVVHLTAMENLRQGMASTPTDSATPLVTYRTEAHQKFQEVQAAIQHDIAASIYHVSLMTEQPGALRRAPAARAVKPSPMAAMAGRAQTAAAAAPHRLAQDRPQRPLPLRQRQEVQTMPRVGRVVDRQRPAERTEAGDKMTPEFPRKLGVRGGPESACSARPRSLRAPWPKPSPRTASSPPKAPPSPAPQARWTSSCGGCRTRAT